MNRFIFVTNETVTKILLLMFVLWFFSLNLLFFLSLVLFIAICVVFKKKHNNILDKSLMDSNVITSPISGVLIAQDIGTESIKLTFKIRFWDNYGIYMPVKGEVIDYIVNTEPLNFFKLARPKLNVYTIQSTVRVNLHSSIKLCFQGITSLKRVVLFTRGGDRGALGANIGYLPFGGKVVIELPVDSKILIKTNDKVLSFQTILGSFKDNI